MRLESAGLETHLVGPSRQIANDVKTVAIARRLIRGVSARIGRRDGDLRDHGSVRVGRRAADRSCRPLQRWGRAGGLRRLVLARLLGDEAEKARGVEVISGPLLAVGAAAAQGDVIYLLRDRDDVDALFRLLPVARAALNLYAV